MPITDDSQEEFGPPAVGIGYAGFQLSKALTTEAHHRDPAARTRAGQRISDWMKVLNGMVNGTLSVGERTPVQGVPNWVTLKVVAGGFATGDMLAGGPLQEHERTLLSRFPEAADPDARRVLNSYYLTDEGLVELQNLLKSGCYDVNLPEEGALLVIAWLVHKGEAEQARQLLETISPWFSQLRFYPIPTERARQSSSLVHLQDVGSTIESLKQIKPNPHVLAQKEAVGIWLPLYDRAVGLFLETVEGKVPTLVNDPQGGAAKTPDGKRPVQGGWPCQHYPEGWIQRASAILAEYDEQRSKHQPNAQPEAGKDHSSQLWAYLRQCVNAPSTLHGRDVGRIRLILACYVTKRGTPDSPWCRTLREEQIKDVSAPTVDEVAQVIIPRLQAFPSNEGVADLAPIVQPILPEEAKQYSVPVSTPVPPSIQRKVQRCLSEAVEVLVHRGLITSGETLARVLPQMTAGIRAASVADPTLRRLYATIYAAFRRRRSLLLLNLEKQVQIEELPWIAAVDRYRSHDLATKEQARQTLEEVSLLAIVSFPHAILPNKLLQELRALANTAQLDLPLVEEVAADIFMGQFSDKFLQAATKASALVDNTLYSTYYGIDYAPVREMGQTKPSSGLKFRQTVAKQPPTNSFAKLCAERAGVPLGSWDPATNGMIIEQQQILTTQNLAVLFAELHLSEALGDQLAELARSCFRWVCERLQIKVDHHHGRLIQVKNAAYAWRQMIFFLALLPRPAVADFLAWAEEHLNGQPEVFGNRFRPALAGLALAFEGSSLDSDAARQANALRFLGWSKARHWLLPS